MTRQQQNPPPPDAPEAQPVFVARQPIFDIDGNIWGFELLYRHSSEINRACIADPDLATMSIIADGFSLASTDPKRSIKGEPRLMVNFPENLILSDAVYALSQERCVVEVLETVEPTGDVLEALRRIRADGYTLALDDYVGQERSQPFLGLVDIVKVDMLGMDANALCRVSEPLQALNAKLLAEKVEHRVQFNLAKKLGYSYFQGNYFERAEIISGHKISAHLLPRLQLIRALSGDDYDTDEVTSILSSDPGLTYRLLQFINSAFFAVANPIKNVRQAVTLLGGRQLRQWLLAVAMTDVNASPARRISMESGLLRARFLQLMAEECGEDPDTLFLVGLFSKLDVLFGIPMDELMEQLPLDGSIKQALLKEAGELGLWLRLTRRVEHGQWAETRDILEAKGISVETAALAHSAADIWANQTLEAFNS